METEPITVNGAKKLQDELNDLINNKRQKVIDAMENGERMTEATVRTIVKGQKKKTKAKLPGTSKPQDFGANPGYSSSNLPEEQETVSVGTTSAVTTSEAET